MGRIAKWLDGLKVTVKVLPRFKYIVSNKTPLRDEIIAVSKLLAELGPRKNVYIDFGNGGDALATSMESEVEKTFNVGKYFDLNADDDLVRVLLYHDGTVSINIGDGIVHPSCFSRLSANLRSNLKHSNDKQKLVRKYQRTDHGMSIARHVLFSSQKEKTRPCEMLLHALRDVVDIIDDERQESYWLDYEKEMMSKQVADHSLLVGSIELNSKGIGDKYNRLFFKASEGTIQRLYGTKITSVNLNMTSSKTLEILKEENSSNLTLMKIIDDVRSNKEEKKEKALKRKAPKKEKRIKFKKISLADIKFPIYEAENIGIYSPAARKERLRRFLTKRKKRIFYKRVQYDVRSIAFKKKFRNSNGHFINKEDELLLRSAMELC